MQLASFCHLWEFSPSSSSRLIVCVCVRVAGSSTWWCRTFRLFVLIGADCPSSFYGQPRRLSGALVRGLKTPELTTQYYYAASLLLLLLYNREPVIGVGRHIIAMWPPKKGGWVGLGWVGGRDAAAAAACHHQRPRGVCLLKRGELL